MNFRQLPSVDRLAAQLDGPHALAVRAARATIDERRGELSRGNVNGEADLVSRAREQLRRLQETSLRPVHNATGVILHTNLGRAPLAVAAQQAVARVAAGYSSLEIDLDSGERGSRQHHVNELLCELTGAEAALVVNNGAAAVLLAVAALAGPDGSVVVSRGQLVEIGGGFRIPEVIRQAGAQLVEVGTTNRTRLADYERGLASLENPDRAILLRVHPSNFRTVGFVEDVGIEALCALRRPVVDDLGSGALARRLEALDDEPDVQASVAAGAALVCFSGDKLLGGPQAGVLVGRRAMIRRAERHPLARALRIDKLSLAALQATLALYRDPELALGEIPVLAMLDAAPAELEARAQRILAPLAPRAEIVEAEARVGGGALPLLRLRGPAVAVDPAPESAEQLATRLRQVPVPVLGRIQRDRLLLDPRTLGDQEAADVGELVRQALSG
jgi:L-seryl-tRNA(Ser) seleniumtransferase